MELRSETLEREEQQVSGVSISVQTDDGVVTWRSARPGPLRRTTGYALRNSGESEAEVSFGFRHHQHHGDRRGKLGKHGHGQKKHGHFGWKRRKGALLSLLQELLAAEEEEDRPGGGEEINPEGEGETSALGEKRTPKEGAGVGGEGRREEDGVEPEAEQEQRGETSVEREREWRRRMIAELCEKLFGVDRAENGDEDLGCRRVEGRGCHRSLSESGRSDGMNKSKRWCCGSPSADGGKQGCSWKSGDEGMKRRQGWKDGDGMKGWQSKGDDSSSNSGDEFFGKIFKKMHGHGHGHHGHGHHGPGHHGPGHHGPGHHGPGHHGPGHHSPCHQGQSHGGGCRKLRQILHCGGMPCWPGRMGMAHFHKVGFMKKRIMKKCARRFF